MGQSKTIYIVRHGQTDFNKNHIVQGSGVDSSLNETGRLQARAFYEKYRAINFEVVITSELIRTHQTMTHFIEDQLPWEKFAEINEMNWGVHEGKKSTPSMMEQYKVMIADWKKGNYHTRISQGESAQELGDRIQVFIDHLKLRPEKKILICSHGRAMRCLMALLKKQELFMMENYAHSNTGLYLTQYQPDIFTFELENDISHLDSYQL